MHRIYFAFYFVRQMLHSPASPIVALSFYGEMPNEGDGLAVGEGGGRRERKGEGEGEGHIFVFQLASLSAVTLFNAFSSILIITPSSVKLFVRHTISCLIVLLLR
jgi:hypothetical protein